MQSPESVATRLLTVRAFVGPVLYSAFVLAILYGGYRVVRRIGQ